MTGLDANTLIVLGAVAVLALLILYVTLRTARGQTEINTRLSGLAERQDGIRDSLGTRLQDQERAISRTAGRRYPAGRRQPRKQHGKDRRIAPADPRAAGGDGPGAEENHRPVRADGRSGEHTRQQAGARGVRRDPAARPGREPDAARRLHVPGDARQRQAGRLPAPICRTRPARSPSTPSSRWRAGSASRTPRTTGSGSRPAAGSAPMSSSTSAIIREKYIVPGETGDAALMFPALGKASMANCTPTTPTPVEQSFREKVYIVSPTTLWATLNTVRAVFRDVRMREQAHLIQKEVENHDGRCRPARRPGSATWFGTSAKPTTISTR